MSSNDPEINVNTINIVKFVSRDGSIATQFSFAGISWTGGDPQVTRTSNIFIRFRICPRIYDSRCRLGTWQSVVIYFLKYKIKKKKLGLKQNSKTSHTQEDRQPHIGHPFQYG